jgi:cellulose synthase/poly-beta-1,6-N-acetylglucosamine synthase-like glycosyltransferase
MTELLEAFYIMAAGGLSLYGLLGLVTIFLYWRHRHDEFPLPEIPASDLPRVTVQLPIYNERHVVERLIRAAVNLDYPADRLEIQVIDDSTDATTLKASNLVRHYDNKGVDIQLLHRTHRDGFKAGALSNASPRAKGEFLALFDADFEPAPDFLRQTIPHFMRDPDLGMIQARWGHLNADHSPLTAAQAIALDKHFVMEQTVRHRANIFPKFNGAGGVWRQTCVSDAGGWQADTVCEDLCLSTRAILKGWRFRFLNSVETCAELPTTITAYKNQQARWAKGSIQNLAKHGADILRDRQHSLLARCYAALSMAAYVTHLLMLILLLVQVPLLLAHYRPPAQLLLLSAISVGQPLLFVLAQQALYPDWRRRLRHFPTMLFAAIGIAPSNARAMLQALFARRHQFVRTPKRGLTARRDDETSFPEYTLPFDWITLVELLFAAYAGFGLVLAIRLNMLGPVLFLASCLLGFSYVALLGLSEAARNRRR